MIRGRVPLVAPNSRPASSRVYSTLTQGSSVGTLGNIPGCLVMRAHQRRATRLLTAGRPPRVVATATARRSRTRRRGAAAPVSVGGRLRVSPATGGVLWRPSQRTVGNQDAPPPQFSHIVRVAGCCLCLWSYGLTGDTGPSFHCVH